MLEKKGGKDFFPPKKRGAKTFLSAKKGGRKLFGGEKEGGRNFFYGGKILKTRPGYPINFDRSLTDFKQTKKNIDLPELDVNI